MRRLAVLLALATLGFAPVRATYEDVGLGVQREYPSTPWKFARDGHTLTQTERDARESFLIGRALPEVIGFAETIPCPQSLALANDLLTDILKLEWNYRGREDLADGWELLAVDRHYGKEKQILFSIQSCALGKATACAHSPAVTPGLLTLLDLRVENGRCVKGAGVPIAPALPFNPATAKLGLIRTQVAQPALTGAQVALLDAADAAHATASNGGTADVFGAHVRLEASARSEAELHRLRALDFHGMIGAGWTAADVAALKRMQHRFYHEAITCTRTGDWACSDIRWSDHRQAHACQNFPADFTFVFAFAVRDAQGVFASPGTWPKKTCRQWVAAS